MSTRCHIASVPDNLFIYCHFDGYLEGVGQILKKYYNTPNKISELLALGDISFLEPSTECPKNHSYDHPVDGYTVAYYRDQGAPWQEVKPRELSKMDKQEYNYKWDGNKWQYCRRNAEWSDL